MAPVKWQSLRRVSVLEEYLVAVVTCDQVRWCGRCKGTRLVSAVAPTCKLPGDARCTLSLFSLSSLWVLRSGDDDGEGGGGVGW